MVKCILEGIISKVPVQTGDSVFGRFTFTIVPNGRTEEVEIAVWNYRSFGKRYNTGDKVTVVGQRHTKKVFGETGVKYKPVIIADSITSNY